MTGSELARCFRARFKAQVIKFLKETDFPWLPEWIADPLCLRLALAGYDAVAPQIADAVLDLLQEKVDDDPSIG